MALSGHPDTLNQCPLLGVKRTYALVLGMSAYDLGCVKTLYFMGFSQR